MKRRNLIGILSIILLLNFAPSYAIALQQQGEVQARSLLGEDLRTPDLSESARQRLETNLDRARRRLEANPTHHDNLIWLGRRLAYSGRYREAVAAYSRALEIYPESPELLRHRGHRYITLRKLEVAVADLTKAAEITAGQPDRIEPDGIPNRLNRPTSTLQTNIWYHLALAQYLQGDFEKAAESYEMCLKLSRNDDMLVATSHWYYMTLRRLQRDDEAAKLLERIHRDLRVIENQSYFDLLLMYRSEKEADELIPPDADNLTSSTVGYGIGNWRLYNEDNPEKARELFEKIVDTLGWAAFGYIAAEAELARMRGEEE